MSLQRLLQAFRQAGNTPLSVITLAQRVQLEPAVVEGMLLTLLHKGRIREALPAAQSGCPFCALHGDCQPATDTCKMYTLVEQ